LWPKLLYKCDSSGKMALRYHCFWCKKIWTSIW
jgi:hypothetical protein